MGWRIVRQPNGKLARFSDVVDNFTHANMTEEEALEVCREHMGRLGAIEKVKAGVEDHKPWTHGVLGSGHDRWDDCIDTIKLIHGEKELAKVLKEIEADVTEVDEPATEPPKTDLIARCDDALKKLLEEKPKT